MSKDEKVGDRVDITLKLVKKKDYTLAIPDNTQDPKSGYKLYRFKMGVNMTISIPPEGIEAFLSAFDTGYFEVTEANLKKIETMKAR